MKKRIISMILCIVSVFSILSITALTTSAANTTSNYSQYTQPSGSDFAYWNGKRMVKHSGTTYDNVRWMQAMFNWFMDNGYPNAGAYISGTKLTVDASFGPASKAACLKFQRRAGLSADGSCGPQTIAKMKSVRDDIINKNKQKSNSENQSSTGKYNLCWPIPKSVDNYKRITSSLGHRNAPVSGASVNHKGIDIGVPTGTPVLAAYDGVVKYASSNALRGNYVVIYHSAIGLTSVYQHLQNNTTCVKAGQTVSKGQQIAKSGATGNVSGPHLHFELVLTSSAPSSVDCAWASGAKLLDGHYNNTCINYEYR